MAADRQVCCTRKTSQGRECESGVWCRGWSWEGLGPFEQAKAARSRGEGSEGCPVDAKGSEGAGDIEYKSPKSPKNILHLPRKARESQPRFDQPTRPTTSTMTPSRRSRLASNGSSKRSKPTPMSPLSNARPQSESSPNHPPTTKPPQPQAQSTMTDSSRYQKNLKSLRRIDPTIFSIVDQFSHICLYRLHEGKWLKDGFEGASFLFERCVVWPCHPHLPLLTSVPQNQELHIPHMASSSLTVPA